eukprot:3606904-Amphidinium_carterae.1
MFASAVSAEGVENISLPPIPLTTKPNIPPPPVPAVTTTGRSSFYAAISVSSSQWQGSQDETSPACSFAERNHCRYENDRLSKKD